MYEILISYAEEYDLDIVQCKYNWFEDENEIKEEGGEKRKFK